MNRATGDSLKLMKTELSSPAKHPAWGLALLTALLALAGPLRADDATEEVSVRRQLAELGRAWNSDGQRFEFARVATFYHRADHLYSLSLASSRDAAAVGWDNYRKRWEPFLAQFAHWTLTPRAEPTVLVHGNTAWTTCEDVFSGADQDGRDVAATVRGLRVWQKLEGRWLIVQEHVELPGLKSEPRDVIAATP